MMRRRASAVMVIQPPISASERPQPMQSPQVASMTHTLLHGDSMGDARSISAIRLGDAVAARIGAAIDNAIMVAALTSLPQTAACASRAYGQKTARFRLARPIAAGSAGAAPRSGRAATTARRLGKITPTPGSFPSSYLMRTVSPEHPPKCLGAAETHSR